MIGHEDVRLTHRVSAVARPAICLGRRDKTSAHRIELYVSHAAHPIALLVDDERSVPTLKQPTSTLVPSVEVRHVPTAYGLHSRRQGIGSWGSDHEMDVIGHERVGMDLQAVLEHHFMRHGEEHLIVTG